MTAFENSSLTRQNNLKGSNQFLPRYLDFHHLFLGKENFQFDLLVSTYGSVEAF